MPWGETVVGFVLEDLCQSSTALYRYCEAHKQELKSIDDVDPLVRPFLLVSASALTPSPVSNATVYRRLRAS
jgi:hypothetical protein